MKWVFNSQLVWGAVLGVHFFIFIGDLRNTYNHHGPGPRFYEEPDRTEIVSESEYKRNEYTMSGFLIIIVVSTWIYLANHAKKSDNLIKLNEEYLKLQINTLKEYNHLILINISDNLRDSIEAKVKTSEAYKKAKELEVNAMLASHSASRAMKSAI